MRKVREEAIEVDRCEDTKEAGIESGGGGGLMLIDIER